MPVYKATLVFKLSTNPSLPTATARRIGGWTESWYRSADSQAQVVTSLTAGSGLAASRAGLLPIGAYISGYRIQAVSPLGPTVAFGQTFPGSSGLATDVPQMALLFSQAALGARNVKRVTLRGIPDSIVVQGEYSPTYFFQNAMFSFRASLTGWSFRGHDLDQPQLAILTISDAGLVTFQQNHAYVVNNALRLRKVYTQSYALKLPPVFYVGAIGPLSNQLTLRGWSYGPGTGGTASLDGAVVYPVCDVNNQGTNKVIVRKVGRPSDEYRGRRSKRRR